MYAQVTSLHLPDLTMQADTDPVILSASISFSLRGTDQILGASKGWFHRTLASSSFPNLHPKMVEPRECHTISNCLYVSAQSLPTTVAGVTHWDNICSLSERQVHSQQF